MRGTLGLVVVVGLLGTTTVGAEVKEKKVPGQVTGFVAHGAGELEGKVTDRAGKPVAGIQVHLVGPSGAEQVVTTDRDGKYRAVLRSAGSHTLIYVNGEYVIGGATSEAVDTGTDGEAVAIRETVPPAVMPKPKTDPLAIPPYSERAIDRNAWARAWLMLDITETGTVAQLKMLKAPGFDLDAIAVREAFALKFEPARDRAGQPMRAMMLWSFEWPSYWWLSKGTRRTKNRVPAEASMVPCLGSGPTQSVFRDCSRPDLTKTVSTPWLKRPATR